jgi:hypothetical protein
MIEVRYAQALLCHCVITVPICILPAVIGKEVYQTDSSKEHRPATVGYGQPEASGGHGCNVSLVSLINLAVPHHV